MRPMHLQFEVTTSNGLGGYAFTKNGNICPKVTQNVAQYPIHHVTYAPTKFEIAGGGVDAFRRKYSFVM